MITLRNVWESSSEAEKDMPLYLEVAGKVSPYLDQDVQVVSEAGRRRPPVLILQAEEAE